MCVCQFVQASSSIVPLQLDETGKVKYDVLARMGQRKDKASSNSLAGRGIGSLVPRPHTLYTCKWEWVS